MNKWSKYNLIFDAEDDKVLIYNCNNAKLVVINKHLKEIITTNILNVNNLQNIHPDLYNHFISKEMIIDEDIDEIETAKKNINSRSQSQEYFRLTINPTLDCNLRCWYCYEVHQQGSRMDLSILYFVKKFIAKKIKSPELKRFDLSFFGGEPLMGFHKTAFPLITFTRDLCCENGIEFNLHVTSNGTLLTPQIIDLLYSNDINVSFQIAFDGDAEFHNKTKVYPSTNNNVGTYELTFNNIKYALTKGYQFHIRCNYTPENIHSFRSAISQFETLTFSENQLNFSFSRVWQATENQYTLDELDTLQGMVANRNLDNAKDSSGLFVPCYADQENCIVINYNGDVFHCTARDFTPENREGILNSDGNIVFNQKHNDRFKSKFSTPICLECVLFPICDVCSQKKLENTEPNRCIRLCNEDEKRRLIYKHMLESINNLEVTSPK